MIHHDTEAGGHYAVSFTTLPNGQERVLIQIGDKRGDQTREALTGLEAFHLANQLLNYGYFVRTKEKGD